MKILLLAIGRKHEADLATAIETYSKRIAHYVTVSWQLIDAAKGRLDQSTIRRLESEALLSELKPDDYVIVLDERGKMITSAELARQIENCQTRSMQRIVFVIGGSFGVEERLRTRAQHLWSLSSLTFPHQLVRLILTEQLYRAYTIMHGEPYHHS